MRAIACIALALYGCGFDPGAVAELGCEYVDSGRFEVPAGQCVSVTIEGDGYLSTPALECGAVKEQGAACDVFYAGEVVVAWRPRGTSGGACIVAVDLDASGACPIECETK